MRLFSPFLTKLKGEEKKKKNDSIQFHIHISSSFSSVFFSFIHSFLYQNTSINFLCFFEIRVDDAIFNDMSQVFIKFQSMCLWANNDLKLDGRISPFPAKKNVHFHQSPFLYLISWCKSLHEFMDHLV